MITKNLIASLIICFVVMHTSHALAFWETQQHTATTGFKQNKSVVIFIVSFNPLGHCKFYEAGLAILDEATYGEPIKQSKSDLPMTLNIDGQHYGYTGYVTQYSNGLEKTIPITKHVIDKLKAGSQLSIKLDHKSPAISFSLENANQAIQQAHSNCLNSL